MQEKLTVTTFTDPMMGLIYECEPIYDRLEAAYPQIRFRWVMSLLVRDVSDFMLHGESIEEYNRRLAKIYESESAVGGLPINMPELRLFDSTHRSSKPLCLAYKAAQLADGSKADIFLKALRHATVVDVRPTTHFDEILRVVRNTGINEEAFIMHYKDGSAETALAEDIAFTREIGIRTLPSYMIQYGENMVIVRSLIDYENFVSIIEQLRKQEGNL